MRYPSPLGKPFHQPSVNLLANIAGYVLVGAYSARDSVKVSGIGSETLDDATDVINLPEMICSQHVLRSRCRKEAWVYPHVLQHICWKHKAILGPTDQALLLPQACHDLFEIEAWTALAWRGGGSWHGVRLVSTDAVLLRKFGCARWPWKFFHWYEGGHWLR